MSCLGQAECQGLSAAVGGSGGSDRNDPQSFRVCSSWTRSTRRKLCSTPGQELQVRRAAGRLAAAPPWHVACFLDRDFLTTRRLHMHPYALARDTSHESAHELERWAGVAMASAVMAFGLSRR